MAWILYLILIALDLAGLLLTAFTLPGLWLMLGAAALYALFTHGQFLGWHVLLVLLITASAAEVGEIYLGGAGAKAAGASKWGIIGGFIGAIVGGIFLTFVPVPILNHVVGICLGTFLGAFGVEMLLGKPLNSSLRIGMGAARGRLFGIVGKLVVGVGMFVLTLFAALPHHFRPGARLGPSPLLAPPAATQASPPATTPATIAWQ
jgi:uncharacterized protein YqgC (DUF456 family)